MDPARVSSLISLVTNELLTRTVTKMEIVFQMIDIFLYANSEVRRNKKNKTGLTSMDIFVSRLG